MDIKKTLYRATLVLTAFFVVACSGGGGVETDGRQILGAHFGGTTEGLAAGKSVELVLSTDRGTEPMRVTANGQFKFEHVFYPGSTGLGYRHSVAVRTQPLGQTCTVGNTVTGVPRNDVMDGSQAHTVNCGFNQMHAYVASLNSNQLVGLKLTAATGEPVNLQDTPATTGAGPSAVAAAPSGKYLYVRNRYAAPGSVTAYAVDHTSGGVQLVGTVLAGAGPTHVVVDPAERFVYVVNHSSDSVSGYTINTATGALTEMAGSPFSTGPATGPQSIALDPQGRFSYVANEASGTVTVFAINATTGALSAVGTVTAGSNPFGITVHPSGKYVYVTNRSSNNLSAYTINATTGLLTVIGDYNTGQSPVAVAIEPSGKYIYVVNTELGTGSVSIFAIDETLGTLTSKPGATVLADPRAVLVDPAGKYLYVVNSGSNAISSFSLNAATGSLTQLSGSPLALTAANMSVAVAISVKP